MTNGFDHARSARFDVRWRRCRGAHARLIASLKASVLYVVADAAASDRTARFIRPAKLPGVEALQATFVRHRYAPHIHDTWTIAHVISGAARFQLEGRWQTAPAGTSFLIAPGAVHTGESASPAGYTYRLLYLEPERLSERGEREFAPADDALRCSCEATNWCRF